MIQHYVSFVLPFCAHQLMFDHADAQTWVKHVHNGHEELRCNTAVALDANGDKDLDVDCQFQWSGQFVYRAGLENVKSSLYRFARSANACIHSTTLDVDDDGDLDWAGTLASSHPFWLENPGKVEAQKGCTWTPRSRSIPKSRSDSSVCSRLTSTMMAKTTWSSTTFPRTRASPVRSRGSAFPRCRYVPSNVERVHVFADGDARGGSHYYGRKATSMVTVGRRSRSAQKVKLIRTMETGLRFGLNPGKGDVKEKVEKDDPRTKDQLKGNEHWLLQKATSESGDGKVDWIATQRTWHEVCCGLKTSGWRIQRTIDTGRSNNRIA